MSLEYDAPDISTLSAKAAERLLEVQERKSKLMEKERKLVAGKLDQSSNDFRKETRVGLDPLASIQGRSSSDKNTIDKSASFYVDDLFQTNTSVSILSDSTNFGRSGMLSTKGSVNTFSEAYEPAASNTSSASQAVSSTIVGVPSLVPQAVNHVHPAGWHIVYRGTELQYTCEGIVPLEVIENEPDFTVQIKFVIQTAGTDYPDGCLSQMSDVMVCSTRRTRIWDGNATSTGNYVVPDSENLSDSDDSIASRNVHKNIVPLRVNTTASSDKDESESQGSGMSKLMSKKKKNIITAMLDGNRTVELEKKGDMMLGSGVFDHFL